MLKTLGFQEKSAWVMFIALCVSGLLYFGPIISDFFQTGMVASPGRSAIGYVIIVVVIAIIGHILAAMTDPNAASAPMDERDRLISHKSGYCSGIVFGLLVATSLLGYLVVGVGDILFHSIFLSFVVAQIVEYALIILSYRRGG